MAQFKYKIAESDGSMQEIIVEAATQDDALNKLWLRKVMVIRFLGEVDYASGNGFLGIGGKKFDVCEFTGRLVPLLNAHIPLEKGLHMLLDGSSGREAEVINRLRVGLREGQKFSEIVRMQGKLFPPLYSNLLEAGEETGSLPGVMKELQSFLNAKKDLRDFLITSSIYPLLVLGVTFVVMILMFVVFIPYFSRMLLDMGRPLPLPMRMLQMVSDFFTTLWWFWPILAGGIVLFVIRVKTHPATRVWLDKQILKIPVVNKLVIDAEISRFFRTLAILIQNHVHLLTTVRIAENVLANRVIQDSFKHVSLDLRSGLMLSATLKKSDLIPPIALQMIQVGEDSGDIGPMLNEVATMQEQRLRTKIKRLLSLFEPAVIVFLAITILIVVLAIFLAIMEMNEI